ncbi:hypothetical protein AA2016_3550 [Aminobacter aminovorans]|uniref:Uncharacterized protein n=1 Tax=Aminobacter aminovorans TaxID=83263 RepID=A0AAC8YQC7_AMIAI|nr:hypothetical protein AA2016_3550 [Aminobacter aminovorans]
METILVDDPSHIIVTEAEFGRWLTTAEPGAVRQYHDGFLILDVAKGSTRLSSEERKMLIAVARLAWLANEQRIVHLVQRRLSSGRFAYLAIIRRTKAPQRVRHDIETYERRRLADTHPLILGSWE